MFALLQQPAAIAPAAAAAGIAMVTAATVAIPFIAVISQQTATSRKTVFYDKFGKQLASMGCLLAAVILLSVAAASASLFIQLPHYFEGPFRLPVFATIAMVALACVLLFAYTASWKKLRKSKPLHKAIGLLSGLSCLLAAFASACLLRGLFTKGHPLPMDADIPTVINGLYSVPATDVFWPVFALLLTGGMAAAGTMGCVYLIARRQKDDFGRDYYNFAMPCCAKWAWVSAIPAIACMGWALYAYSGTPQIFSTMLEAPSALGLLAAGTLLHIVIAASKTPMRMKGAAFLAVPLVASAYILFMLISFNRFGLL